MERQPLLILGASARAAAWSAWRTGWLQPLAIDLFADRDLAVNSTVACIAPQNYPHGLETQAATFPDAPWVYTGGLENRPALVDRLARQRPLWGNPGHVLRRVRSPFLAASALARAGLPTAQVRTEPPPQNDPRPWLIKPLRGAGGVGIAWWQGQGIPPHSYFQEWIEGDPCSAQFLANHEGKVAELGVTRQLIGESWLHAGPFRYCGSVGPLSLPEQVHVSLQRLGETLTGAFGLRGLFGVDFILREETPYLVEINPRYTASVEVLERATDFALVSGHGAAFVPKPESFFPGGRPLPRRCVGKAIYFAARAGRFPEAGPWEEDARQPWSASEFPHYADIPAAGVPLHPGQPVMTVFSQGDSPEHCINPLQGIIQDLDRRLAG